MATNVVSLSGYQSKVIASEYTGSGGQKNPNFFGTNKSGILMMNTTVNGNSHYKDWLIMDAYHGSDVGGGVAIGVNRQALGAYIMRSDAGRASWAQSAELFGTHNLSYLDGRYVNVTGDTMTGLLTTTSGNHAGIKIGNNYITAINGELIFQNNTALRFGGDSWDYNVWAGLRYVHSSKTIYLGLADGSIFTANNAQSGGTVALPGISYLSINGKRAFSAYDTWLRINEDKQFSAGVYFGSNTVRTDGRLEVGSSGNSFLVDASGNCSAQSFGVKQTGGSGYGISLYGGAKGSAVPEYGLAFMQTANGGKYGDVQGDWATYFTMNTNNQRGWVWKVYNQTAAAYMAGSLSSRGVFTAAAVGNSGGYLAFPQGGTYSTQTATVTGALKVKLPRFKTNCMICFDVNITTYDESNSNLVTYRIYGYEYGDSGWHPPVSKAFVHGKGDKSNLTVRFCYDGSTACITIGEVGTTWRYPQVSISNITYGYSDVTIASWGYGWSISFITTLPSTIAASVTNAGVLPVASGGTGGSTAASARANLSTWSLISSSYNTIMPPDGTTNSWYKFGTADGYGLLPALSGGATGGHSYIGTSTWYWKYLYVDEGNLVRLRVVHNSSNNPDDAVVYVENKSNSDWAVKINCDGYNYGINVVTSAGAGNAIQANGIISGSSIKATAGYLYSIANSNTVTIGSQNASFCHIYNSVSIPFIFNNSIACAGTCNDTTAALGTTSYPFHRLILGGATNATMTAASTNPRITFQENTGTQPVHLIYTDYDSYRGPAGLKVIGGTDATPAWFEVEGNLYVGGSYIYLGGSSYIATNHNDGIELYRAGSTNQWLYIGNSTASGQKGIYFPGYGGGWYMTDSTWLRAYNNKPVYVSSTVDNAIYTSGGVCALAANGLRICYGNRAFIIRNDQNNTYLMPGSNANATGNNWASYYSYVENSNGYWHFVRAYGAVWNDYAEYRVANSTEPGRVVKDTATGRMEIVNERLAPGCKIISDTYGFAIGETEDAKSPIAVSGRVLVYPYQDVNKYEIGAAVCSAPNGTVDIMTREEIMKYPERIVGTVSEIPTYTVWEQKRKDVSGKEEPYIHKVEVKGRIWIYVK